MEEGWNAHAWWLMLAFIKVYRPHIRVAIPTGGVLKMHRAAYQTDGCLFLTPSLHSFPSDPDKVRKISEENLPYINRDTFVVGRSGVGIWKNERITPGSTWWTLRHLEGMPLCIPANVIPPIGRLGSLAACAPLAERILELLNEKCSDSSAGLDSPIGGRLIDRIIEHVVRTGDGRDATRRAVDPGGKVVAFQAAWVQASRENPDLCMSKPGRKPKLKS